MQRRYFVPDGGYPPQDRMATGRACFTESYAVIPNSTMQDIVVSHLPFWDKTRFWVLARPMSGFSETFSHSIAEIADGGGSDRPELDPEAEAVVFVVQGTGRLTINGQAHAVEPGSYAYIPAGCDWQVGNDGRGPLTFHWIRKRYVPVEGLDAPLPFVTHEDQVTAVEMPGTENTWVTQRFVNTTDMAHDMHVNIITFQPGAHIPFMETHVMEHGLYILQGRGVYRLNQDWVEVQAGDFLWLRAFCPQACYAGQPGPFRYLLYKDVNRHMPLKL